MTDPIGAYTFLPWIRHGVANQISGPGTSSRATVDVAIDIEGTNKGGGTTTATVNRIIELYGPGDIIGIDSAQISRVEPENWVTNFEPNYLAAIEFYDEDFPWRYTPAASDGRRLLPWLALIVLEEGEEFSEGGDIMGRPLPYVEVTASFADVFPDAAECWAWAHAHFNAELSEEVVETDESKAAQAALDVIDTAPDTACARLLCPRKLKPKTGYHAFLIPAFESGRLAGLGYDPKTHLEDAANGLVATSSAWGEYDTPANRPDPTYFPVYHRWYFRTAERGDFESLVRLLQPKVVNSRVGHRDLDVTDPAPNITGIDDAVLGGILRLGGALKAPLETLSEEEREEFETFDQWATPYPHAFQSQLAAFVNLADSYQNVGAAANADDDLGEAVNDDPDPLVTPPLYGRWHALTERLLTERDGTDAPHRTNWVHDLNLDPRWRTAAGYGTSIIQKGQESYMEAAWDQIGDVLEANRRIRQAQLATVAGTRLHTENLATATAYSPANVLVLASPMKRRVVSDGITINHRMLRSPMGVTMTSAAMRRAIRPGGKVAKQLDLSGPTSKAELVVRANDGAISAAPPKTTPEDILTPDDLADAITPGGFWNRLLARLGAWIRRNLVLAILLLLALAGLVALLFLFTPIGLTLAAAVVVVGFAIGRLAWRASGRQQSADALREENQTPAAVDDLQGSSAFVLIQDIDLLGGVVPVTSPPSGADNAEADRYKAALKDEYTLIGVSGRLGETPTTTPLDLEAVAQDMVAATRPDLTVPRWTLSGVTIPTHILDQMGTGFVEAMAYPEFDTPMYEPLAKAGAELFVPNLHLVESNSVTLLETNQKFIEAYMIGLNHEFARELLWREYPTDQRGSYFRQFWDVRKKIAEADDEEAAREQFKDIKPLHQWPAANDLGDNDNREEGAEPEEELVLVIRGELLKKYPNTIISAQPAMWQTTEEGEPDKTKERVLDDAVQPIVPLYEARVAPDIYFFGFDLTAEEARGDDTVDDEPGWFFRIEEVPGDARFGFDISRDADTDINVWNDLAWADVVPGLADGVHIKVADIPELALIEPSGDQEEKREQWEFDKEVPLDADLSAAELAYVALQTPVLMAVHASELLPDQQ